VEFTVVRRAEKAYDIKKTNFDRYLAEQMT
jgi:hypothetical protein